MSTKPVRMHYPDTAKLREQLDAADRRIHELKVAMAQPENRPYVTYYEQEIESIRQSAAPCRVAYERAMDAIVNGDCCL